MGSWFGHDTLPEGFSISPVLAIITTADPLISIGVAHFWLKEKIASAPLDLVAEGISLAIMTGGIVALAHRAPHVSRQVTASG
jgi:hypothetical protein